METGRVICEIVAAALAVFGFYCVVKMISEWLLAPSGLSVAVTVYDEAAADNLDLLLHEARRSLRCCKHRHIVVLFSSQLMQGHVGYGELLRPDIEALVRRYEADCYVVEPSSGRHT
jgi:hypothetical protein